MGHRGKQTLLDFSLSATLSVYYDAKVMLPLSCFICLNSLKQVMGRVEDSFWVFCFLTNLKSISQKAYFGVTKLLSLSLVHIRLLFLASNGVIIQTLPVLSSLMHPSKHSLLVTPALHISSDWSWVCTPMPFLKTPSILSVLQLVNSYSSFETQVKGLFLRKTILDHPEQGLLYLPLACHSFLYMSSSPSIPMTCFLVCNHCPPSLSYDPSAWQKA